jgi:hypothetical protein
MLLTAVLGPLQPGHLGRLCRRQKRQSGGRLKRPGRLGERSGRLWRCGGRERSCGIVTGRRETVCTRVTRKVTESASPRAATRPACQPQHPPPAPPPRAPAPAMRWPVLSRVACRCVCGAGPRRTGARTRHGTFANTRAEPSRRAAVSVLSFRSPHRHINNKGQGSIFVLFATPHTHTHPHTPYVTPIRYTRRRARPARM